MRLASIINGKNANEILTKTQNIYMETIRENYSKNYENAKAKETIIIVIGADYQKKKGQCREKYILNRFTFNILSCALTCSSNYPYLWKQGKMHKWLNRKVNIKLDANKRLLGLLMCDTERVSLHKDLGNESNHLALQLSWVTKTEFPLTTSIRKIWDDGY